MTKSDQMDQILEDINTPDQIVAYNKAVGSSRLEDVRMICSSFNVMDEYWDEQIPRSFDMSRTFVGCSFEDEKIATAVFKFEAVAKGARKKLMKIVADYAVTYSFAEGVDPEAAKVFSRRVGMFAAYPYYRAWVASVSSAANIQLPILPVIASRATPIKANELKE